MKKTKIITLMTVIVLGLVALTGCTKSGKGVDLKLDLKHMNNKVYNAHINLTEDDNVTEQDEEEANFARIENEKK